MHRIELRIDRSAAGWSASVALDGTRVGDESAVSAASVDRIARQGRQFLDLFEQGVRPLVDPVALTARPLLAPALATGGELVVASARRRGRIFAFETDEGATDLRTAEEIAATTVRGGPVRLFVLSACKSARAGTAGLCRALTRAGLPHALGWAASVEDGAATHFANALYGES